MVGGKQFKVTVLTSPAAAILPLFPKQEVDSAGVVEVLQTMDARGEGIGRVAAQDRAARL